MHALDYPDEPPRLRRLVVVLDFDSGRPLVRMWQLWRSGRVDCYRMRGPSGSLSGRIGWARALVAVREAYTRLASPRRQF